MAVAGALASAGMIEREPGREATMVNEIEVTMKMIAAVVVALESSVAPVRWPNAAWLDPPPKVPDQSALLPCCSRTTSIRNTQTIT